MKNTSLHICECESKEVQDRCGRIRSSDEVGVMSMERRDSVIITAFNVQPEMGGYREGSCTASGLKKYTCTQCGYSYTQTIPAYGHDVVNDFGYEAGCESNGLTDGSHCSRCGKVFISQCVIAAKGHDWTSQVVTEYCFPGGSIKGSCGEIFKDVKEWYAHIMIWDEDGALSHGAWGTYGNLKVTVYTCTRCRKMLNGEALDNLVE